jgi:hypothetical protein
VCKWLESGVAAPGAGSAAEITPTAMAELSMPPAAPTLPPWKGKPMSMHKGGGGDRV